MTVTNSFIEMFVQQARNVLNNMKDLQRVVGNGGKKRVSLIERFTANHHSFNVYTYANEEVKQSPEVQVFKEKLTLFNHELNSVRFDIEGEVNEERLKALYEEILNAYNEMVTALGFEKEIVNVKRF
nr:hypothetical protein [Lysinibacillus timonensis]